MGRFSIYVIYITVILVLSNVVCGCSSVWLKPAEIDSNSVYIELPLLHSRKTSGFCGELAVEQLMLYNGIQDKPNRDKLQFDSYNDTVSVLLYARSNNIKCRLAKMTLAGLYEEISSRRPVIVFIPPGGWWFSEYLAHCITVSGYNNQKNTILFYSDGSGPYEIDTSLFMNDWGKFGSFAICLVPHALSKERKIDVKIVSEK